MSEQDSYENTNIYVTWYEEIEKEELLCEDFMIFNDNEVLAQKLSEEKTVKYNSLVLRTKNVQSYKDRFKEIF